MISSSLVLITLAAYLLLLFVLAYFSGRKADNAGFFIGNRRTTWYMATLAMIGAAMSGVTFISVPGSVAADSFSYMQMVIGFTIGQMIVAFVLIPVFYRQGVVSLYEWLDARFGVTTHRTGAWLFFISKILAASLRAYVICVVLQALLFEALGVPFAVNALIMMTLVWLYTRRGGVRSVVWGEFVKSLVMVGSIVAAAIVGGCEGIGAAVQRQGSGYNLVTYGVTLQGVEIITIYIVHNARVGKAFGKKHHSCHIRRSHCLLPDTPRCSQG